MKYKRLSPLDREMIFKGLQLEWDYKTIAKVLDRSESTIGREIYRHGGASGYSPSQAQEKSKALAMERHKKKYKLIVGNELYKVVYNYLRLKWSPRQISNQLNEEFPNRKEMQVSAETIYEFIYVQTKGTLKKELIKYLRQKKRNRKPSKGRTEKRGKITEMISIDQRPAEVAHRIVPGHWEGDLIMGKGNKSQLGTLVERKTRYVILVPLKSKETTEVRKSFQTAFKKFPKSLTKTLTYDQGKEMAEHSKFTLVTKMKVFFCDPGSPWQRGTNENTNMLVRDFFPKGTDFTKLKPKEIKWVQEALNERIRETLFWKSPKYEMNQLLAKAVI